jgi:hypothetical protein
MTEAVWVVAHNSGKIVTWCWSRDDAEQDARYYNLNHSAAGPYYVVQLVYALELEAAIMMLAEWCVAVDENGTGWDDWDEHYKDAMYRPGPLRERLDVAISKAREVRRSE